MLYKLETALKSKYFKLKGLLLKIYLILHGCKVGKNLKVRSFPTFRTVPRANITIGDNVRLGHHITFQMLGEGKIILKDHVNLTQNILLSASKEIYIGNHSGLAEFVSVRDSYHEMKADAYIDGQRILSEAVRIGDDVGIGRGCAIFHGARVPDGAVIGAHSVITKHTRLIEKGIYFGTPAKLISKRT